MPCDQKPYPRVQGQLHPADRDARETGRFLVVANGGDVAPKLVREAHPHHDHRQDEEKQCQGGAKIGLAEVGEPRRKARDRLGVGQTIGQPLEEGERAEGNDQRVEIRRVMKRP